MNPVQIIITIAACVAVLIVLYFALASFIFAIMAKRASKELKEFDKEFDKGFDSDFFKRHRGL